METISRRELAKILDDQQAFQLQLEAELPLVAEAHGARLLDFSHTHACLVIDAPAKVIAQFWDVPTLLAGMPKGSRPKLTVHRDAAAAEEFEAACKGLIRLSA